MMFGVQLQARADCDPPESVRVHPAPSSHLGVSAFTHPLLRAANWCHLSPTLPPPPHRLWPLRAPPPSQPLQVPLHRGQDNTMQGLQVRAHSCLCPWMRLPLAFRGVSIGRRDSSGLRLCKGAERSTMEPGSGLVPMHVFSVSSFHVFSVSAMGAVPSLSGVPHAVHLCQHLFLSLLPPLVPIALRPCGLHSPKLQPNFLPLPRSQRTEVSNWRAGTGCGNDPGRPDALLRHPRHWPLP